MSHVLSQLLFVVATGAMPPDVATLVKQLGDPKFAVREAAQRELIKRGEGIAPELAKYAKTTDAETAERLRKILYHLIGYKDDIRRLLGNVPYGHDSSPAMISSELRGLIAEHQPGAGDLLLTILTNPRHAQSHQALRAFIATWDSATPEQIDTYVQQNVTLTTTHRPRFPAKVGAMISFEARLRHGWTGWTPINGDKKIDFRTRTTRYLDGKPYEKPFEYPYPFATVGWYKVGELAEGKHTIHAVMEYEYTQRGVKRKGEIRSESSIFEVVSANTPDDLIAPKSEDRLKRVKTALELVRSPPPHEVPVGVVDVRSLAAPDEVHVSWETPSGKRAGLSCIHWEIRTPLDVDLCFAVEIHDVKTGKAFPADSIVVPKGQRGSGYIMPRDVRAFAADREGIVAVKVVRTPSRGLALSYPSITSYFPESITTENLQIKVFKQLPTAPLTK